MPQLPIPPNRTIMTNTNGSITNVSLNSHIGDIAEQKARMIIDEWMKEHKDLFESKETKLRIQNIQSIVGMSYDDRLTITGVIEEDKYYEFILDNSMRNAGYRILLHRRQTDSGHYIMEYDNKTLWLCRDEIDTPDKIIICMNTI